MLGFEYLLYDDLAFLLLRKIIFCLLVFLFEYEVQCFTIKLENVHFETLVRII